VAIERFIWTLHAEDRAAERGLSRLDVEEVVRDGHRTRQANEGLGDWRVYGTRSDGQLFAVVYDQPALEDDELARIVTIWRVRNASHS
jgi:hypothetical protein